MEKSKYICPRTSRVNVKVDGFILSTSTPTPPKYSSSGLGHSGGISGKGDGADASGALAKTSFWEFN